MKSTIVRKPARQQIGTATRETVKSGRSGWLTEAPQEPFNGTSCSCLLLVCTPRSSPSCPYFSEKYLSPGALEICTIIPKMPRNLVMFFSLFTLWTPLKTQKIRTMVAASCTQSPHTHKIITSDSREIPIL